MRALIWVAAAAAVAGCNQSGADNNVAANVVANTAAAEKPKHPTYCFYQDANTKGWSARRDKSGNVSVKGKAYLEDSAYSGSLVQGEVAGDKATIWITTGANSGKAILIPPSLRKDEAMQSPMAGGTSARPFPTARRRRASRCCAAPRRSRRCP